MQKNEKPNVFPNSIIEFTSHYHFQKFSKTKSFVFYFIILLLISSVIFCSWIKIDLTVDCSGVIRSLKNKTEVKLSSSGMLEELYIAENKFVKKGELLLKVKSQILVDRSNFLVEKKKQLQDLLFDLEVLIQKKKNTESKLKTNVFLSVYALYNQQVNELEDKITIAKQELKKDEILFNNNALSHSEILKKQYELKNLITQLKIHKDRTKQQWQSEKLRYSNELKELESKHFQLEKEKELFEIKAPISGYIQNIAGIHKGSFVQAGQSICVISPNDKLIGEFYISPKDIGLIKENSNVKIQVQAFNYNDWGFLNGTISDISNDVFEINKQVYFKSKCKLNSSFLKLKNGYKGNLRNGMTLNGHIIVAKRTILQLVFDDVNNWLNPTQNGTNFNKE
jgi:multidrug resistance efflux pump